MTARQALSLTRRVARKSGYRVEEVTDDRGRSRGKGSHANYALIDSDGREVARFGLTDHGSRDISPKLLNRMETVLAPFFGDGWRGAPAEGMRAATGGLVPPQADRMGAPGSSTREAMSTYQVIVTREDDLWVAEAHGVPENVVGVMDYESLTELHEDVPLWLADLLNVPDEDVGVEYRYEVGGRDVTETMRRLFSTEAQLRELTAEREHARKQALAALSDAGLSQRAMASALDISHQRVHQLVHS